MKTQILFEEKDYRPLNDGETYEGKFVIISSHYFNEEYREAKYQPSSQHLVLDVILPN